MEFGNGFIEDDNPVIPPGPSHSTPATSFTASTSSTTRQDDTLDLTGDSPPPQTKPSKSAAQPLSNYDALAALDRYFYDGDGATGARVTPAHGGHGGISAYARGQNGAYGAVNGSSAASGAGGFLRPTGGAAVPSQPASQPAQGFAAYARPSPSPAPLASTSSAARQMTGGAVHQHPLASTSSSASFGRIPVISSASSARMPSQYLSAQAGPSSSGQRQHAPSNGGFSSASVLHAQNSPGRVSTNPSRAYPITSPSTVAGSPAATPKGKEPAVLPPSSEGVVDLTDADDSDPDDIIVDETPVCIGQLTTFALIVQPFYPIIPPLPVPKHHSDGRPLTPEELEAAKAVHAKHTRSYQAGELPVWLHRSGPQVVANGEIHDVLRLHVPIAGPGGTARAAEFGFLDYKCGDNIASLLSKGWHGQGPPKNGVYGKTKMWCEAYLTRAGETNPCLMRLRLVLFARPFDANRIGDCFEAAKPDPLYLDHPAVPPGASAAPAANSGTYAGWRYANPHNPAKGVGEGGRGMERLRQHIHAGIHDGATYGASRTVKDIDAQRQQVAEVFENLKSGIDLEQVEPPPIVSTPLYPHQKQALSFLLDRESLIPIPARDPPGQPTVVSLWKRRTDPYGRTHGWVNLVTDQKIEGDRAPPQARGAILADDMGLGKTIVVISLVCTTLPEAHEWASQPITKDLIDSRFDETLNKTDLSGAGRSVGTSDFGSNLYGLSSLDALGEGAGSGKKLSKKKQAKQRREKKRDEMVQARYERLEVRSRATLIVCPLSTVQNWESQFEEHTKVVEVDEQGGKVYRIGGEEDEEAKPPRKRAAKGKGKAAARAKVEDSEEEGARGDSTADSAPVSATEDDEPSDASLKSEDEDVRPKGKAAASSKRKKRSALSIYIYHGNARVSDPRRLADHDVVITTFSTLGTEFSKQVRAEEEREDEEERQAKKREEEAEGIMEVYGFGPNGEVLTRPPGIEADQEDDKAKKPKRKRKPVEGTGVSPLQAVQWFRVVLDEAHIIKEHKTIQAKAACDLSTARRIALSGTPLQNSLNDIFSLLRFIRLEPFTDRGAWNQYIGALAQKGEDLGAARLKLVMRHIALRRTKDTKDADGKPILSLPPIDNKLIELEFNPTERAFYASHHTRYKHDFAKLEETDSVMKNFCSILQELLKLRQICVHPGLLQDSEDRSGGGDLGELIAKHGISKPRAIQLIALFRDASAGDCSECGHSFPGFGRGNVEELGLDDDEGKGGKKPAAKKRKTTKATAATSTGVKAEDGTDADGLPDPDWTANMVVTRCQHLFCLMCFKHLMCAEWPRVGSEEKTECKVCKAEFLPALDAVEIEAGEFRRALERSADERPELAEGKKGKKPKVEKKKATRLFEHSTKTRALVVDLLPFSQVNPASANYDASFDPAALLAEGGGGGTIGFQPVKGEAVKSVVFSQWTTLLDRLGDALSAEHIKFRRLDGAMNRDQRTAAMDAFKCDPATEVLLVSLRAGGVGLNLTAGRRVYLMEPFWNPAVENQAVDRIYRLGQTKPVQTIRFVMANSIESNMRKIQKRKMELAQMSVGRTLSKAELAKQRLQDVRDLLA